MFVSEDSVAKYTINDSTNNSLTIANYAGIVKIVATSSSNMYFNVLVLCTL